MAVVLAGGDASDALAADAGVAAKALVPLGDRPLGAFVLQALRGSGVIDDIVYVGPTDVRLARLYDAQLPAGERLVDSLALGLGAALSAGEHEHVLLVSADIPWITGEMVARFVEGAAASSTPDGRAALVYPIVTEASATAQFPHQRRTYARLKDGRFTGGNMLLLDRALAPALLPLVDRVFRARKNPFALASIVGLDVLLAFVLGHADVPRLEKRVSQLLGAPARALLSEDAALAADVDSPAHMPGTLAPNLPAPQEMNT